MKAIRVLPLSLVTAVALSTTNARAEVPLSTWSLRFDPGVVYVRPHLRYQGSNESRYPLYFGLNMEGAIVDRWRAGFSVGTSSWVGALLGATLRYQVAQEEGFVWSVGAGPLVADMVMATGVFAQADTTLQFTSRRGFVVMGGASTGFALNSDHRYCDSINPCELYLDRGDWLVSLRVGVGVVFPSSPK